MQSKATKSYNARSVTREVVVVDLAGKILGRAATRVADILRGKNKPQFTPHANVGDTVVAINAGLIRVTGNKLADKKYWRSSGYPGGEKSETLESLLARRPEEAFRRAVRGMLPKNKLQAEYLKHLKVYADDKHAHEAQNPRKVEL